MATPPTNSPDAPGWRPDPTGRHELRFWDGRQLTDQVCDRGVVTTDSDASVVAPTSSQPPNGSQTLDVRMLPSADPFLRTPRAVPQPAVGPGWFPDPSRQYELRF